MSHIGPEPRIQKLNLAKVSTRRRHMLGEEVAIAWNSYTARSTALAATLTRDVSVEAGEGEQPDTFNTHVVDEFPDDVILVATREPDESALKARWTSKTKVLLYLERLLKIRPLKTPRGFRAHIPVSKYVMNDGSIGLRLHLSAPRFAAIGSDGKPNSPSNETAVSSDKPEGEETGK